MGLADIKIFLRSRSCETTIGLIRNRDEMISDLTAGGDDAVNAIKGAFISARSPPNCLNDLRKSSPLLV